MKKAHKLSALLLTFSVILAVGTVVVCFFAAGRTPLLLKKPPEAETLAAELVLGIRQGNFEHLSDLLADHPDLGPARESEDPVGRLLYQAFQDSLTLEALGECYAEGEGVAMDAKLSYLDVKSVIVPLREQVKTLLRQRVREARSLKEIYNEKNEYREDLIEEVLGEAGWICLRDHGKTLERDLTIHLVFSDQQWKIRPDEDLISILAGGM